MTVARLKTTTDEAFLHYRSHRPVAPPAGGPIADRIDVGDVIGCLDGAARRLGPETVSCQSVFSNRHVTYDADIRSESNYIERYGEILREIAR